MRAQDVAAKAAYTFLFSSARRFSTLLRISVTRSTYLSWIFFRAMLRRFLS